MENFSFTFITRKQPTDKFEKKEIKITVLDTDVEPNDCKRGYAIHKAHLQLKEQNYELRLPIKTVETRNPA